MKSTIVLDIEILTPNGSKNCVSYAIDNLSLNARDCEGIVKYTWKVGQ